MRLVIAGSRGLNNYDTISSYIDNYLRTSNVKPASIISGGAKGVDTIAMIYSRSNNIPFKLFPANWKEHGKAAGHKRNRLMAEEGTHLLAFWDGESKGTKNMIDTAKELDLEVTVINGNLNGLI